MISFKLENYDTGKSIILKASQIASILHRRGSLKVLTISGKVYSCNAVRMVNEEGEYLYVE